VVGSASVPIRCGSYRAWPYLVTLRGLPVRGAGSGSTLQAGGCAIMRPVTYLRGVAVGLVAVGGLLVAGCDDSGTTETAATTTSPPSTVPTTGGTAPAGAGPDCSLAPEEFVSEHIGVEVTGPAVSGTGPFAICSYNIADGTNVGLRFQYPASAADVEKEKGGFVKGGAEVTDVSGLGDAAFSSTYTAPQASITTNTLAVSQGDVAVIISSQRPLDDIRHLMEAILAKL
jgi:hypothetical protein